MEEHRFIPSWPQEVEIPSVFHSIDTGGAFEQCCVCEKHLVESGEPYLVEKSFKRVNAEYENTLFEYAICLKCAEELNASLSKDSLAQLQAYFAAYFNPYSARERRKNVMEREDAWLDACLVKGTPRAELNEYNVCGLFQGDKMLLGEFPYVLGWEAMDELVELLSAETKDELDNFKSNFLDGPPELKELLKGRPVLVV